MDWPSGHAQRSVLLPASQVYELDGFRVTHASRYPAPVLSLGLSPDCSLLAVGTADGALSVRRHARPRPAAPGMPGGPRESPAREALHSDMLLPGRTNSALSVRARLCAPGVMGDVWPGRTGPVRTTSCSALCVLPQLALSLRQAELHRGHPFLKVLGPPSSLHMYVPQARRLRSGRAMARA